MYTPNPRPSDLVKDELPDDDSATPVPTGEEIEEAIKDAVDSELMINVIDLDPLYGVAVDEEANVTLDMTLTSPTCPLINRIEYDTKYALGGLANLMTIDWVWLPPWTLEMITEGGHEQLRAVGYSL